MTAANEFIKEFKLIRDKEIILRNSLERNINKYITAYPDLIISTKHMGVIIAKDIYTNLFTTDSLLDMYIIFENHNNEINIKNQLTLFDINTI